MSELETRFLRESKDTSLSEIIAVAAQALRKGKLVVFPTETVYGLGANIFNERAVLNIFRAKGRPADNPLIVHVGNIQQAKELMLKIPDYFETLAEEFWPGPLTMVVRRNAAVLDCITTGLDSVAIRMPDHPIAQRLICVAGVPLAAPSANISGRPSPTIAEEVWQEMRGKIYAILDGGPCKIGIESTVLDLTSKIPTILRPGSITKEAIENIINTHVAMARSTRKRPSSPGMKYLHYAPRTPLVLFIPRLVLLNERIRKYAENCRKNGKRVGIIASSDYSTIPHENFFSLGDGLAVEYARLMYLGLRTLDKFNLDVILCPGIPEEGVGLAVMNRLKKAAAKIVR